MTFKQTLMHHISPQDPIYRTVINAFKSAPHFRFQQMPKSSLEPNLKRVTNRSLATPATNRQWNTSFFNRTPNNVTDFNTYDFSRPTATRNLGSKGNNGTIAAQLKVDFGNGRPARNVQPDNFALQAWTSVKLQEGKFYKLSSASNDGTRFLFKNHQNNEVLTTLDGDWRDRSTRDSAWSQVLSVPQGGTYDFYIQYYEKSGRSAINVKLEEVSQTGRVITPAGLNVRQQPSIVGNTPFNRLDPNDTFKIRKQVKSADANNPDWYEVQLNNGRRGYVAAEAGLSELVGGSNIVAIGTNSIGNPNNGITTFPPLPRGNVGATPSQGLVKGSSTLLRSGSGTTSSILGDLSKNTPLNIVDKVSGETYIIRDVPYDQWYKVKTSNGQTGYVAAYYINSGDNGSKYSSALNPQSHQYESHLTAANPYKKTVTAAAAPYSKWLKPSILAAIGSRESGWGAFLDSNGTGDGGHGRGIMQIDDRFHPDFIATQDWRNPGVNIKYAVDQVLASYYTELSQKTNLTGFDLLRGAIAAYNCGVGGVLAALDNGLDIDANTASSGGQQEPGDYSWDVIQRAGWFQDNGWA